MVYKRYRGRRLKTGDKDWNKGKWVVEFMSKRQPRYLALGSRIFSLARVNGMIESNPFSHVRKLAEGGKRERYLTRVEETRLMDVLRGELEYLRAPVTVSIGTGVRKSELLSLKVGEINFGQLPIFYRVSGRDLTTLQTVS
jgi:integrase